MAVWHNPELESIFGGPLDTSGITEASIQALVGAQTPESDQLDFKGVREGEVPYPSTRGRRPVWGTEEQEFAKDVVAFANHRGGVLLIGMREENGVATTPTPITASTAEAEEQRLRRALLNNSAPFMEPAFVTVPATGGAWYLAVVIPPSRSAPHAVLGDRSDRTSPLRYPVRHGRDTIWMSEHEVADRYRRRLSAAQEEERRAAVVVAQGAAAVLRSTGVWLYMAAVPETPVIARLDESVVHEIDSWQRDFGMASPLGRNLAAYGRGIPAPGRVTFTGSRYSSEDDETTVREAYVELHVDGSAYAAKPLDPSPPEQWDRHIGSISLSDDTIMLSDVVLRWCARQAGSYGSARLTVGIIDSDSEDGSLRLPLMLASGARARRSEGTRSVTGRPVVEVSADLAAVRTVQERLAVTYLALSGLLQWFGLPESRLLKPDGTLVCRQFGTWSDLAEQWAGQWGVNAESARRA